MGLRALALLLNTYQWFAWGSTPLIPSLPEENQEIQYCTCRQDECSDAECSDDETVVLMDLTEDEEVANNLLFASTASFSDRSDGLRHSCPASPARSVAHVPTSSFCAGQQGHSAYPPSPVCGSEQDYSACPPSPVRTNPHSYANCPPSPARSVVWEAN